MKLMKVTLMFNAVKVKEKVLSQYFSHCKLL